jgi:hypothetical protein
VLPVKSNTRHSPSRRSPPAPFAPSPQNSKVCRDLVAEVRELRLRLHRIFGDRTENRLTLRFAELSGLDDRHVLDLLKGANSVGHVWWEFLEAVEQASANAPATRMLMSRSYLRGVQMSVTEPRRDRGVLLESTTDIVWRPGRESSANGQTRQARWLANGSRRFDWVEVPCRRRWRTLSRTQR